MNFYVESKYIIKFFLILIIKKCIGLHKSCIKNDILSKFKFTQATQTLLFCILKTLTLPETGFEPARLWTCLPPPEMHKNNIFFFNKNTIVYKYFKMPQE